MESIHLPPFSSSSQSWVTASGLIVVPIPKATAK
jgi:hypothetical protein